MPKRNSCCTCTNITPTGLRTTKYNCEVHRYLRTGEAIYMVAGEVTKFRSIKQC